MSFSLAVGQGVSCDRVDWLSNLPDEVTLIVLSYLSQIDLSQTLQTSRHLNRVGKDESLWGPFWQQHKRKIHNAWKVETSYEKERELSKAYNRYYFQKLAWKTQAAPYSLNAFIQKAALDAFLKQKGMAKILRKRLRAAINLRAPQVEIDILLEGGASLSSGSFTQAVGKMNQYCKLRDFSKASEDPIDSEILKTALASGRSFKTIAWLVRSGAKPTRDMHSPVPRIQAFLEKNLVSSM